MERGALKHYEVFGDVLMGFYDFLGSKPKPSDEEVRNRFIESENRWKTYCRAHGLSEEASRMFNKEVSLTWKKFEERDEAQNMN